MTEVNGSKYKTQKVLFSSNNSFITINEILTSLKTKHKMATSTTIKYYCINSSDIISVTG